MKYLFCSSCNKDKPATADNFQRDSARRSGFRAGCKECRAARKKQSVDITDEMTIKSAGGMYDDMKVTRKQLSQVGKITIKPVEEAPSDLASALDAIYQKHQRFFTFQYSKNGVTLSMHGEPTIIVKGTAEEVIEKALSM